MTLPQKQISDGITITFLYEVIQKIWFCRMFWLEMKLWDKNEVGEVAAAWPAG